MTFQSTPEELRRLQQVPPPEIPVEARPHVAAYLRWLGDDDGAHGGLFCRWDRNEMIEHADKIENLGSL